MQRNKNNNGKRKGRSNGQSVSIWAEKPPPYTANFTVPQRRFRFIASAAGTYQITPAKLGALLSYGTLVNQVGQIFEQVRVHSVSVWSMSSTTAPVTCSVTFEGVLGGLLGRNYTVSDTSMGSSRNSHIRAVPPINSQAAQWQNCNVNNAISQNNIFSIFLGSASSVIDVVLSLAATRDARVTPVQTVNVVTAVVGQFYYMALDNAAGGTGSIGNQLIPDGSLITTV